MIETIQEQKKYQEIEKIEIDLLLEAILLFIGE
jgi:hypothetical protein